VSWNGILQSATNDEKTIWNGTLALLQLKAMVQLARGAMRMLYCMLNASLFWMI